MRVECCNIRVGHDRAPHVYMCPIMRARSCPTRNVPLDLSCETIARRDFMIGLSYFDSFNKSHF